MGLLEKQNYESIVMNYDHILLLKYIIRVNCFIYLRFHLTHVISQFHKIFFDWIWGLVEGDEYVKCLH